MTDRQCRNGGPPHLGPCVDPVRCDPELTPETHTVELTSHRNMFGVNSGHHGSEGWTTSDGTPSHGSVGGPSISGIVGRMLGSGSRVRVTVEVIEERPLTVNPWHADPAIFTSYLACCKDKPRPDTHRIGGRTDA
jgi:hypothetical protein